MNWVCLSVRLFKIQLFDREQRSERVSGSVFVVLPTLRIKTVKKLTNVHKCPSEYWSAALRVPERWSERRSANWAGALPGAALLKRPERQFFTGNQSWIFRQKMKISNSVTVVFGLQTFLLIVQSQMISCSIENHNDQQKMHLLLVARLWPKGMQSLTWLQ